jgi:UDP-N-acetylmuramoyl-tripeptide--D-alanyl-D-alanine ligase
MNLTLQQAAQMAGGTVSGEDVTFKQVSTDTRTIKPGDLYIALQGENFDGHDFVAQAKERGAVAALLAHPVDVELPQLLVKDTRIALGELAAAWRATLDISLVAVTGSNGKTTVKEMLAAILSPAHEVLVTEGNLNNDIGMPLTLLRLRKEHRYGVVEMGANHHDEIAYLSNLAKPDVAVITNASTAHLAGFGDLDGVARAKGEIFQGLDDSGIAIINADDVYAGLWYQLAHGNCAISFGVDHEADVHGQWSGDERKSQIHIDAGDESFDIALHLPGRHNVLNAMATTAAAMALGISSSQIKAGLEGMRPVQGRLQAVKGIKGSHIIDDTYNANPASLRAALAVLSSGQGEKYLALGDMCELGDQASAFHAQAGKEARLAGVDRLYAVGDLSKETVSAFGEHGHHYEVQDDLIEAIEQDLSSEVTLLVKGSRLMHMEHVVKALCTGEGN